MGAQSEYQVVHVHLLDGTSKNIVIDAHWDTVTVALRKLVKKLKLQNAAAHLPYFGLYESDDGLTASDCLSPGDALGPVYQKIQSDPQCKAKLFLKIRTITHSVETSVDPPLIHLRYVQAVHEVISGEFCCSIPTATRLAAHMIVINFPDDDPAEMEPEMLLGALETGRESERQGGGEGEAERRRGRVPRGRAGGRGGGGEREGKELRRPRGYTPTFSITRQSTLHRLSTLLATVPAVMCYQREPKHGPLGGSCVSSSHAPWVPPLSVTWQLSITGGPPRTTTLTHTLTLHTCLSASSPHTHNAPMLLRRHH